MQIPIPICFQNYIGLPVSCQIGGQAPISGRRIDSLVGISALKLSQISDSDDVTVKSFCERMIGEGIMNGLVDFKNAIYATQKHEVQATLTSYRIGEYNLGTDKNAPAPVFLPNTIYQRGLRILGTWRIENRITKLFIRRLNILANCLNNPTLINIKIINNRTGRIDLIPVNLIPNEIVAVELNYTCVGNEITILLPILDTNNIPIEYCDTTVQETYFSSGGGGGCCGGGGGGSGGRKRIYDAYVQVDGWDGQQSNPQQLFGIIPEVEAICDEEELYCIARQTLGNSFANFLLYKIGVEITKEALSGSDRFNWVSSDREQLEKNLKMYEDEAKKLVDNLAIQFKGTLRSLDSDCVRCYDAKSTFAGF